MDTQSLESQLFKTENDFSDYLEAVNNRLCKDEPAERQKFRDKIAELRTVLKKRMGCRVINQVWNVEKRCVVTTYI